MLVDVSPPPRPPKHSMSEAPLVYPPPPPAPLPAQSSHRAQSHATRASVATPDISPIRHLDSSPMHPSSMIAPSISSPPPTAPPPPAVKIFSMAEVQRHNQRSDAWIVVRGVVYDVTSFARRHPGGSSVITDAAGTDATTTFVNNHNEQTALRALKPYEVGVVGR
ncbi:nitrate reductase, putative [Bodo saltans]|uniref:Nitrate reductase, putative n=1 Tax=Bodo saltans TaxID=75058 RepID=A0A0S4JGC1_BODSA|nr:nitrate reductase, putative [Bodo saltans]|eukprot:CUG90512.1 nitrate reductase, putative [Bodo saltans]